MYCMIAACGSVNEEKDQVIAFTVALILSEV
jgi:hypothetical protein